MCLAKRIIFLLIFLCPLFVSAKETPRTDVTIYNSSIKWENEIEKGRLLEKVPQIQENSLKLLFDSYKHPERFQLPFFSDSQKYNIQFLNVMWGPLDNPFNKYPRLVKAFLFLNKSESAINPDLFFMAPIGKNLADGNYYIFNNKKLTPQLLSDWVNELRFIYGYHLKVKFNICDGYGNFPNDSCATKNYQNEVADVYGVNKQLNSLFSAKRAFHENWKTKIAKSMMKDGTIYDESILWENTESRNKLLQTVVTWPNYKTIKENFEKIRDIRYIEDEVYKRFFRRISWLFPDDGCWTRASAVAKDLFGPFHNVVNTYSRPSKLFAFGNLCVVTSNSPEGKVTWWYHTAPIVRDAQTNQTYVLDPSINPHEPLPVEKWMKEVESHVGPCRSEDAKVVNFNICNGYGATPYHKCQDPFTKEASQMLVQLEYQRAERERQVELGRDANKVLGDEPPWKS